MSAAVGGPAAPDGPSDSRLDVRGAQTPPTAAEHQVRTDSRDHREPLDRQDDRNGHQDGDPDDDLEWRADDADVVEWRADGPATEVIGRATEAGPIGTDGPGVSSDPGVVVTDLRGARVSRAAESAVDGAAEAEDEADLPPGKRVRVVLSQRKGTPSRPVRTVVDVQELTQVGELLSTSLIRSQLSLSVRIGGIAALALGAWPAIFILFPALGRAELFGLRLPWLLLGLLAYPFLLGLGYLHSRSAEKLEQLFADHIQN